jgi:glycosyltransferase involved in cell wall biosynthesis
LSASDTREDTIKSIISTTLLESKVPISLNELKENIDIIFATCPPHSALIIGAVLKSLTGKPLVIDYRDDWIDTPWFMAKPAISRRVERILENWAVSIADKVILVTEWSMKAFQGRYPKQPMEKFNLIPNGCDLADFKILKKEEIKPQDKKFSILHAGSLNKSAVWGRSLEGFFQAVQKLLHKNPELKNKLVIKFAGDFPEEYRKQADKMGISSVIEGLGHISHAEVLQLTKSSDLLLALNYDGWATLIPGKIYEYWAVGEPPILLLSCPGAATEFIHKHKIGVSVDPNDVDGIQKAILHGFNQFILGKPSKINSDGIELYDRKYLTIKLAQILTKLA